MDILKYGLGDEGELHTDKVLGVISKRFSN